MRRPLAASLAFLISCPLFSACGDDSAPPPTRRDTGGLDTSELDTNSRDSQAQDTARDIDPQAIPCEATSYLLAEDPTMRHRDVWAASSGDTFFLAWDDETNSAREVQVAELSASSGAPTINSLTTSGAEEEQVRIADNYAIWINSSDGSVQGQRLNGGLVETLSTPGTHTSPQLVKVGDDYLAGWLRQDGGNYQIEVRTISTGGMSSIEEVTTIGASRFAMDAFGSHRYFAWGHEGNAQLLTTNGEFAVTQGPSVVSAEPFATSDVALAFGEGFGVVVFVADIEGVRQEVRVRLMNADGTPSRPVQVASHAPLRGKNPTAAYWAGGYAVAFRAREGDSAHVHLSFVHGSTGEIEADYNLGQADYDGGRLGIAVANDGTLAVGWANVEVHRDLSTQIHGARLDCEGAWLRCGVRP